MKNKKRKVPKRRKKHSKDIEELELAIERVRMKIKELQLQIEHLRKLDEKKSD